MDSLKEVKKRLKKDLTKKRYEHSLGVQYTAACLAMRYGCGLDEAMLAGILHDCAKHLSDEDLLKECKKNHIEISKGEARNPYLLHAKMGAQYATTQYKIEDKEVLGAIRYHTTGRPEMTLLEKIIFTSDYIEPNRKTFAGLAAIREQAFINLNKTVALILDNTIQYLEAKKGAGMDEATVQSYQYYIKYM